MEKCFLSRVNIWGSCWTQRARDLLCANVDGPKYEICAARPNFHSGSLGLGHGFSSGIGRNNYGEESAVSDLWRNFGRCQQVSWRDELSKSYGSCTHGPDCLRSKCET